MTRPISWHTLEESVQKELISSDNRWRISLSQTGTSHPTFFLQNSDLLLMPHGTGASYRACFEHFIRDCDRVTKVIAALRQEAIEHLLPRLPGPVLLHL